MPEQTSNFNRRKIVFAIFPTVLVALVIIMTTVLFPNDIAITLAFGITPLLYLLIYSIYGLRPIEEDFGQVFARIVPVLSIMVLFTLFMWFIAFVYRLYPNSVNFQIADYGRYGYTITLFIGLIISKNSFVCYLRGKKKTT
jgi:hypothetical protein